MPFSKCNEGPNAIPAVPPTLSQSEVQYSPGPQNQAPLRASRADSYTSIPTPRPALEDILIPYRCDRHARFATGSDSDNPNPTARNALNPVDPARKELFLGYKGPEKVPKEKGVWVRGEGTVLSLRVITWAPNTDGLRGACSIH